MFLFTWIIAARHGTPLVAWGPPTLWMRSIAGSISMLLSFKCDGSVARRHAADTDKHISTLGHADRLAGSRPSADAPFAVAVVSGVAGVAFIEGPQSTGIRAASVAALLASFCTAIVMIGLHRLRSVESLAIVVHFSAVATIVCFLYSVVTACFWEPIDLNALKDPNTILLTARRRPVRDGRSGQHDTRIRLGPSAESLRRFPLARSCSHSDLIGQFGDEI